MLVRVVECVCYEKKIDWFRVCGCVHVYGVKLVEFEVRFLF